MKMKWARLLSSRRLGSSKPEGSVGRSRFQRDFDRIIFSSSFRRLQDKAQVVPLPESDYVRTRLTHSLEASSVGRSLGTEVGLRIKNLRRIAQDLGAVVAAACVAHDIGNPPFGHSGEDAIQHWFKHSEAGKAVVDGLPKRAKNDFLKFEGNAQGFRILTRLQNRSNVGGLQLTYCTLAAFTKYPRESLLNTKPLGEGKSTKKFGFFQAEKKLFRQTASAVGLIKKAPEPYSWSRHPLAFLVEAADDICYHIIDFEDGFRLGRISFAQASEPLREIAEVNRTKLKAISGNKDKIEYLRAKTINCLIEEVSECFLENEDSILKGEFDKALISVIPSAVLMSQVLELSCSKIYSGSNVVEVEAAGFNVLGGLLETFVTAVNDVAENGNQASKQSKKFLQLMPGQFLGPNRKPPKDLYTRILLITDFVSGMTDSYAVSLYKKIKGISLPTA